MFYLIQVQTVPSRKKKDGFPVCHTDAGGKGIAVDIPKIFPKTDHIIVFSVQDFLRQPIAVFHHIHLDLCIAFSCKFIYIFSDLFAGLYLGCTDRYLHIW